MKLFEYYRRESKSKIECLEGRWHWEVELEENEEEFSPSKRQKTADDDYRISPSYFMMHIKWVDLFKEKDTNEEENSTTFSIKTPKKTQGEYYWNFLPFNRYFGLISFQDYYDQNRKKNLFWAIEFCWKEKTCRIGEIFDLEKYHNNDDKIRWLVLPDKKIYPNSNYFPFLFYSHKNSTHIHCRLNTESLYIKQLGVYELNPQNFDCLNLNGSIISGLANETKEIHQFDMEKGEFLKPINVSDGFPLEKLRCAYGEEKIRGDKRGQLRTAGAWSNNGRHLFVWSEKDDNEEEESEDENEEESEGEGPFSVCMEKETLDSDKNEEGEENLTSTSYELHLKECQANESIHSKIYHISLDDGKCSLFLDHIFNQTIGRLIIDSNDKLYIRNDEFIGRGFGEKRADGTFEGAFDGNRFQIDNLPHNYVYHFYRLSIGKSESLLFLTYAKASSKLELNSTTTTKATQQLVNESKEDIPRNFVN